MQGQLFVCTYTLVLRICIRTQAKHAATSHDQDNRSENLRTNLVEFLSCPPSAPASPSPCPPSMLGACIVILKKGPLIMQATIPPHTALKVGPGAAVGSENISG